MTVRSGQGGSQRDQPGILLTGATGFFGAFLLRELVTTFHRKVQCLVRAAHAAQAAQRVRDNLARYDRWDESMTDHVAVITGNLAEPLLGLSRADFDELAKGVNSIYHNGAIVHSFSASSCLRATNVGSAVQLVELAATAGTTTLHYVSTDSARQDSGSAYAESKRQAEGVVHEAAMRGLPANIYRIPRLGPDSRTGLPNDRDIIMRLLDIILTCGAAPDIDFAEAWIPVDLAARTLIDTAERSSGGEAFSLEPREHITLQFLVRAAREHGFDIETLKLGRWLRRVRSLRSYEYEVTISTLALDDGPTSSPPAESRSDLCPFRVVTSPGIDDATLGRYFRQWRP